MQTEVLNGKALEYAELSGVETVIDAYCGIGTISLFLAQVGCIHTSQGLEFEYVGLIIGADLRYTEDGIITDPFQRASTDKSLSGFKKHYKTNPVEALKLTDQIIKNTYRALMSRGMKGCYSYRVDPALSTYLKKRLEMKEVVTYI